MKSTTILTGLFSRLCVVCACFCLAAQAELVHRYSFTTDANDSVGTAHGVLKGNGALYDGAGQLVLPGGTGSAASAEEIAGYVDLPNGIFSGLTSVSFEAWVTWWGTGAWQRVFDFGVSSGGEDSAAGNGNYLFLSPQGDANLRFAVRDPATGSEPVQLTSSAPLETGTEICLTVTYDTVGNVSRLYSNGVLMVTGPAVVALKDIQDVNNWLGRSQWNDNMFAGSYNEFRVYDNALNPLEVAASYKSGTEKPSLDPASLGTLQSVQLIVVSTSMAEKDTQTAIGRANYASFGDVSLSGVPGVTYASDNSSVLTVDSSGFVTAVGAGTAKLSLSFQGKTDEETVTVKGREIGLAVAGTLVVDLQASDTSADASIWRNRAGAGDFTAVGFPTYVANVAGTGIAGVQFNAVAPATDAYEGPVTTEELHGSSDRSIEVWAYNPALADEETLVAWGRRGGPDGSNLSFNYGANGTYGAVGHWGAPDMGWSGSPAAGQWHYLVYTYDGQNTARVYADGLLKTTRTVSGTGLNTHPDLPIRIAAQANTAGTDFDLGQALSGYLAMVRVHTGLLGGQDVANNFLYGPNLTPPGELQNVTLEASHLTLLGARAVGQARVIANFANIKNLDVTAFSQLESSDPTVLTVTAAGVYTALKIGTATISATYQGQKMSKTSTVSEPPPPALKHRYSFSEAAGSTVVKDSVGSADGTIKGEGAAFDGSGKLALPGGTGSAADPVAGYVDLPNHIINPLVNVSFEAWVTWDGAGPWQRVFDFGTSAGGEDVVNGNGNYLFLSPQGDVNLRFAARDPRTGGEPTQLTSSAPLTTGTEVYLAVAYDYTGNQARLYSNGVQVATGPAAVPLNIIDDVNNWLGRSQWNDQMFQGSYNEFRIYEGALSTAEVAASMAAGPDQLPVVDKPVSMGISLVASSVVITWPATATGFALESSAALGAGAQWKVSDAKPVVEGGMNKVTLPIDSTMTFYRLRK